jgi:tetratricopeptide (TPR) repeat protein
MQKIIKYFLIIFILLNFKAFAKENFFQEAKILFEEGKIKESKFLFQRNIVFNPKDSKSYLYLAKIFESEENEIEEEKNIYTTLLLEPDNEEAMYMLIDMKLEKSDIKKAEELRDKFKIICNSLCSKIDSIEERLSNINVNNAS